MGVGVLVWTMKLVAWGGGGLGGWCVGFGCGLGWLVWLVVCGGGCCCSLL